MRKVFAIIIMLLLCVPCYAADTTVVSVAEASSEEKNKISVNIVLDEESRACGGKIDLKYDNTLLTPKSYGAGELIQNSTCMVNLKYDSDIVRLSWAGVDELSNSGIICNITFTVISTSSFDTVIDIANIKLADANGNPISVTTQKCTISHKSNNSSYGSRAPSASNTGKASPTNQTQDSSTLFTDVSEESWYYDYIKQACESGIMTGISDTLFSPDTEATRAMFVTVLYRMDGQAVTKKHNFVDVETGSWYEAAVSWASENGIVKGVSETEFAPNDNITREQIATIMYRYALYKGYDVSAGENTNISYYSDYDIVSEYAVPSVRYAVGIGLMKGKTSSTINPSDNATRAEIAAILLRFVI